MRIIIVAASLCVSALGHCFAQTSATTMRVETRIEPQPLGKALKEFAASHHMEVLFFTADVKGLRTQGVSGELTADETLTRLLSGTGLSYRYVGTDAVSILPVKSSSSGLSKPTPPSTTQHKLPARPDNRIQPASATADPPGGQLRPSSTNKSRSEKALSQVVITGSRLSATDKGGPQEVQIYSRQEIDQSGQNSIASFLTTIPSVSLASPSTALGVGTTVTLRGLPVGTTLVLLNGRPLESSGVSYQESGGNYFDLSNIPLAAVERIEVDENGSSAVYGSDAIAGVVNIITKTTYDGFAVDGRYGWAKDDSVKRASLAWGKQWEIGGFSIIGSFSKDGGLSNTERLLSSSNDYTNYGGPDKNYPVCFPGNVLSINGTSLPGAPAGSGATYAAVTQMTGGGKPPLSSFAYGTLNTCAFDGGLSLLAGTTQTGVLVEGHLEIAPSIQLFTEVLYSHDDQVDSEGYQSLYGLPGLALYTVSPNNPYNPFGTIVGVAESLREFPGIANISTDFMRPLVGLKGTLSRGWQWEISSWQSTDWSHDLISNLVPDTAAIRAALNSSDPATALNPFVDGPIAPASLTSSLFSGGNMKWKGQDRYAQAFIRGPVLTLPAGVLQGVIGGDYDRSAFDINDINTSTSPPNTRANYTQNYYAVFGEARIPLIGGLSKPEGSSLLSVTVAGRHDEYANLGGATTEQFGVEIRPTDEILIRGAYSTAFKAPPLPSVYGPDVASTTIIEDPITGASSFVKLLTGGNEHLRPMTGHSHTLGIAYLSRGMPGIELSATQWQVVENNAIQAVAPQVIVDNAGVFPGLVIRNAEGQIEEVDDTKINFGSIDAAGIDYQLQYRQPLSLGTVVSALNVTQTYHYTTALIPGAAAIDADSVAQDSGDWAPRWKGVASIDWTQGPLSTYLDGRYTGRYRDYDSNQEIGNFWVFDASVHWNFEGATAVSHRWLRGTYVGLGATNIFNRAPQFSRYEFDSYGYDVSQASILGRELYAQLGVRW